MLTQTPTRESKPFVSRLSPFSYNSHTKSLDCILVTHKRLSTVLRGLLYLCCFVFNCLLFFIAINVFFGISAVTLLTSIMIMCLARVLNLQGRNAANDLKYYSVAKIAMLFQTLVPRGPGHQYSL